MTLNKYTKLCMYKVKVLLFCIQNIWTKFCMHKVFKAKSFALILKAQSSNELKL